MLKTTAILLLMISTISYSQNDIGIVYYGQVESMGMKSSIGHDYSSVLIFDKNKSIYITRNDSIEKRNIYEHTKIEDGDDVHVVTKATNAYGLRYFTDILKDSLYSRDIGFTYVKEKKPTIVWDIKSETKKIGNYDCIKAIAEFRGRNYTAWFTTDIPLPYGPWKLQGLPGLILEVYDTNKEVFFYFKNLKYPSDTQIKIAKPVKQPEQEWKKWISLTDYKKFLIDDYLSAINAGRMFAEGFDSSNINPNIKYNVGEFYIENFDINEFIKKD